MRIALLWLVFATIPLLHPLAGGERRDAGHGFSVMAPGVVEPLQADRTDEPDPTPTTSSRAGARVPRPIVPERDPGTPAVASAALFRVAAEAPAADWRENGVRRSSGVRVRLTGRSPPGRAPKS